MNLEKLLKYVSIVELASTGMFLLFFFGRSFLESGSAFDRFCAAVSSFLWLICGLSFFLIMVVLMIWFWRLLFNIASGTTPLYKSRELTATEEKKIKFPIVLVIVSVVVFLFAMILVVGALGIN